MLSRFSLYFLNSAFSYESLAVETEICRCSMILLMSVSATIRSRNTTSDLSLLMYDLMMVCLWCYRSLMI